MFQKHILQVAYTLIYSWNGCPFTLVMTVSLSHFDHCWIHRHVVAGKKHPHWCHAQPWRHNDPLSSVPTQKNNIAFNWTLLHHSIVCRLYLLLYSCLLADRSQDTCDSWSYCDHFWYIIITKMIRIVHCHITALFAIFLFLCLYCPEALTDPL